MSWMKNFLTCESFLYTFVTCVKLNWFMVMTEANETGFNQTDSRIKLRSRIIEVSMDMFKRRGIKNVTMDEIASVLGISKRTLYEIFDNKEELLVDIFLRKRQNDEQFYKRIESSNDNVIDLTLKWYKHMMVEHRYICTQFFSDIKKYPKVLATIESINKQDREKALNFYNRGVKEGVFRDDINYEIIDMIASNQFNVLVHSELFVKYDFELISTTLFITFLRGISTMKGQEILEQFIKEYNSK